MVLTDSGDSIEGQIVEFSTRRFVLAPPIRHETLGRLYRFRLSIFAKGTISQELDPKVALIKSSSNLSLADEVRGEKVMGLSGKLPKPRVSPTTSTHKASVFAAKKPGYATVEIGIRHLLQKKTGKKQLKKKALAHNP